MPRAIDVDAFTAQRERLLDERIEALKGRAVAPRRVRNTIDAIKHRCG